MPNALNFSTPPPPDIPQAQPQNMGGAGPQQTPAPSHEHTVAMLRHFMAVGKELRKLLQNPDLGKADVKSSVIDGFSKLVGDRILPAAQAATVLGQMPDRPFEQRTWLSKMFAQNMQAQVAALNQHRQTNRGTGDVPTEMALHGDTSDDHMDTMNGAMAQYGGSGAGR